MEELSSSAGDRDYDGGESEYGSESSDGPSLSCSFSPFESGDDTPLEVVEDRGIEPYQYEPDASSSEDLPEDEGGDGDPRRLVNTDWLVKLQASFSAFLVYKTLIQVSVWKLPGNAHS